MDGAFGIIRTTRLNFPSPSDERFDREPGRQGDENSPGLERCLDLRESAPDGRGMKREEDQVLARRFCVVALSGLNFQEFLLELLQDLAACVADGSTTVAGSIFFRFSASRKIRVIRPPPINPIYLYAIVKPSFQVRSFFSYQTPAQ